MASEEQTAKPTSTTAPESGASLEEKFALVRSVGQECISDDELKNLLAKKPDIRCYDGFEPSGRLHIAQGLFKAVNVNKCTASGCTFIFWVGDWFALMNDKMGGDLEKIKTVGKYLIEVWTAAGMDMDRVQFKWSSDEINGHAEEYWKRALDIGRRNTLTRLKKCCQIMGRAEGNLSAAQILYPLMQCTDVFYLRADICQLGLDQRKVNMLAREYCDQIGKKLKPVILSHHMLSGLLEGQAKMSKSNPESAIFMEDTPEDVERKITNAYCPRVAQKESEIQEDGSTSASAEKNPVLDYIEHIIFSKPGAQFVADDVVFTKYSDVEQAFLTEKLSEQSLKKGLIVAINKLLDPIRQHFVVNERAKELLECIKAWRSAPSSSPKMTGGSGAEATPDSPSTAAPHLVAWLPCLIKLPLGSAIALAEAALAFNGKVTIVAADWASFANNNLNGDDKGIEAVLDYNKALLQTLISNLPLIQALSSPKPMKISFLKQSELILQDPSTYWLTAISVGRKLDLKDVEGSLTVGVAGQVVGSLMHVADAVVLNATEVVDNGHEENINDLVVKYTAGRIIRNVVDLTVNPTAPPSKDCQLVCPFPSVLCDPKQKPSSDDDFLYLDDTDMDIGRKIKRGYCAPQDLNNYLIPLAEYFIERNRGLLIKRTDDQGGNKSFANGDELKSDYVSGALHPGDLKAAVKDAILALTQGVRESMKNAEVKKLNTAVKTAEKKAAKTSGGK